MAMYPPTDEEMDKYPHVFFTADSSWDPRCFHNEFLAEEFVDSTMPEDFVLLTLALMHMGIESMPLLMMTLKPMLTPACWR